MKHKKLQRKSQEDGDSSLSKDTNESEDEDMERMREKDHDDICSDVDNDVAHRDLTYSNRESITCVDDEEIDVVSDTDTDTISLRRDSGPQMT